MATSYKIRLKRFNGTDYDTLNLISDNIIMSSGNNLQTDYNNLDGAIDDIVYVGDNAPTDPNTKIWLDTDASGASAVNSINGKAGTVVLDADDVGAMSKMDLLWTNASPTSSFANQTITLDLSDYDAVLVKSKIVTDINGVFSQLFFKSSGYSYLFFVYTHIFYRYLEISDSGILFGHSNFLSNYGQSTFTAADNYAIPLQIYGVKVVA